MNKQGILYGLGAYTLWGLFPAYWRAIETVPALQILGHRMVWSLLFTIALLSLRRDWAWLKPALGDRRILAIYTIAALLLSVNWGTYIWAVNAGYIVETSLGYFINPLVSVLLGVVFLGERLRKGQVAAAALAGIGVLYLAFNYGRLPWIALLLAFTFGLYGLVKKTAPLNSTQGFSIETLVMFLPALAYLLYAEASGQGAFGHQAWWISLLLFLAGAVTSIPLLLFGAAARRVPLSMLGFLQYIAPTLQLILGVFVFHESFPPARLLGFAIIWLALIIYTIESLWFSRRSALAPNPARAPG